MPASAARGSLAAHRDQGVEAVGGELEREVDGDQLDRARQEHEPERAQGEQHEVVGALVRLERGLGGAVQDGDREPQRHGELEELGQPVHLVGLAEEQALGAQAEGGRGADTDRRPRRAARPCGQAAAPQSPAGFEALQEQGARMIAVWTSLRQQEGHVDSTTILLRRLSARPASASAAAVPRSSAVGAAASARSWRRPPPGASELAQDPRRASDPWPAGSGPARARCRPPAPPGGRSRATPATFRSLPAPRPRWARPRRASVPGAACRRRPA